MIMLQHSQRDSMTSEKTERIPGVEIRLTACDKRCKITDYISPFVGEHHMHGNI